MVTSYTEKGGFDTLLRTPDLAFLRMETNPLRAYVCKALLRTELAAIHLAYFALLCYSIVIYARTLRTGYITETLKL